MSSIPLEAAAERIADMLEPHERLLAAGYADSTDGGRYGDSEGGHYFVTLRLWEHPEIDDAYTLSIRYAYLTRDTDSGSDGWQGGGNFRVYNPAAFCQGMSRMFAGCIPRLDTEDADPDLQNLKVR